MGVVARLGLRSSLCINVLGRRGQAWLSPPTAAAVAVLQVQQQRQCGAVPWTLKYGPLLRRCQAWASLAFPCGSHIVQRRSQLFLTQVSFQVVELVWTCWLHVIPFASLSNLRISFQSVSFSCGGFMPPNVCGLFYKLVVNFLAASDGFRMIARFSLSL